MAQIKFGKPVTLFNGRDLEGWKLINEKQKNGFSVIAACFSGSYIIFQHNIHIEKIDITVV